MSMPKFPDKPKGYQVEDSLSQILTSIAMEELGLSHIINAEGEKIQYVLGTLEGPKHHIPPASIHDIIKVNESVKDMLETISMNQMFLFAKMSAALTAYFKNKKGGGNGGGNPGDNGEDECGCGGGGEEDTFADDGQILHGANIGDTSDWVEIAQNGVYSLIVRQNFINIYEQEANYGDVKWQKTFFGASNKYETSTLRNKINEWFRGTAPAAADNLPANAKLRNYTVQNTALYEIGLGPVPQGVNSGISKPIAQPDGNGYDVAFVLSYGEAANFVSKEYAWDATVEPSSDIAQSNFAKMSFAYDDMASGGLWLRSPGSQDNFASYLWKGGRAFQIDLRTLNLVYPALWVHQDVFSI